MARGIWMSVGGDVDLDVITADAGDVLAGKVTVDREGEPLAGALTLSGNADTAKVLKGYTFYNTDAKSKLTGTLEITSVVSFDVAQYSNLTLIASWAKPIKGPWSGVRVICKQGGYPENVNDGTLFHEGSGTSATKLLASGTWYFRAWNYVTTSIGRMYGGYIDKIIANNQIKGLQKFTSSGIFTVPTGVYSIDVFCVGGGGGGNGPTTWSSHTAYGGGGGYTNTVKNVSVVPGQKIGVSIGAGGAGGNKADSRNKGGKAGGATIVGSICTALGGDGGYQLSSDGRTNYNKAGDGGSGGGTSGRVLTDDYVRYAAHAGTGGSDGADGTQVLVFKKTGGGTAVPYYEISQYTGIGQHRTTRMFGENSGELYSGGGGGGAVYNYASYSSDYANANASPGGSGGGGAGSPKRGTAGNGAANTGGGGGAGSAGDDYGGNSNGGNGGSGIAVFRWGY